jgi:hypothetical protein
MQNDPNISIETMYGSNTHEPFVILKWGKNSGQLSPTAARIFAFKILSAAETSEQDAFMFDFAKSQIKADDATAARVLAEFREYRLSKEREV